MGDAFSKSNFLLKFCKYHFFKKVYQMDKNKSLDY